MLPPKNRLLKKKDFEEVKKKGRKFQSRFFGLLVQPTDKEFPRFGFILSTKISKKATKRNRAKRLLREAVRKILPRVAPGLDVIFLGKREIFGRSQKELEFEVEKIFIQAGVVDDKNSK